MHTLKLGVGAGHNRCMHSPVRLNSICFVSILVGGGALERHTLVLSPGAMLWYMCLDLMSRVLVLQNLTAE